MSSSPFDDPGSGDGDGKIPSASQMKRWNAVDELQERLLDSHLLGNLYGARLGNWGEVPDEPIFNLYYSKFVASLPSNREAIWKQRNNDRWVGCGKTWIKIESVRGSTQHNNEPLIESIDDLIPPPHEAARKIIQLQREEISNG